VVAAATGIPSSLTNEVCTRSRRRSADNARMPSDASSPSATPPVSAVIRRPRIYLAGPDVFFPGRRALFAGLIDLCESLGLEALPPWEGAEGQALPEGRELAQLIRDDNLRRIRACDGLIANLVAFRGLEPDSGTVFEMGFAVALGKPVVGYGVEPGTYAERVARAMPCETDAKGRLVETASRRKVEDLGHPLNLMLACSGPLVPDAEAALRRMAGFF